ncbi:MAG: 30S ribosomal protein S16 [Flavobacteriales bacterium]|nr:30S ribosomal protein S16 [Flavobacteriales bacterium]
MATKIRLQRHGKKSKPFYYVVVADSRAPRDGKFIERLGSYNPNTYPITVELDVERALHWVKTGAQPTDTCRSILSTEGVLLRNHLDKGVVKGAMTEAEAETKFAAWTTERDKKSEVAKATGSKRKKNFAKKFGEPEPEAVIESPSEEAPVAEKAKEEAPAEAVVEEEVKEEAPVEAPTKEETPAAPAEEESKEEK